MPRSTEPKPCACGCADATGGGDFLPGHDQRLRAMIEQRAGGLLALKQLVENALLETIQVSDGPRSMGKKVLAEVGRHPSLTVKENSGNRFPVKNTAWRTGSLWLKPLPSTNQYMLQLTGDALARIQWKVVMGYGKPVRFNHGYPVWHIRERDLPRTIEMCVDD